MSPPSVWISVMLVLFCNQSVVLSYRILCVFPTISRSHFLVVEGLAHGLAAVGHNVTVIGPRGVLEPIENYYHIETKMGPIYKNMLTKLNADPGNVFNVFKAMLTAFDFSISQAADIFRNKQVQRVLSEDTFDLVLIEAPFGEPLLGMGPHFNCPTVMFTSLKAGSCVLSMFNNPLGLAYVPNLFASFVPPMNFLQRVQNMLMYLVETPLYHIGRWKYENAYNEFFPAPKYPSYRNMLKNVSLLFITQHFHCDGAQPLFPNIIEVSGIHLNDQKRPISSDLDKWMNQSTKGVVYFSLGTIFNITQVPAETLVGILDALGKIEQNILFKTDTDHLPFIPTNVRVEKWVPQIAVLQHKNTKMFITHAGLGSITEARYYGVPVLAIPIGIDQFTNAITTQKEGWGLVVPFKSLNGETLYSAIQEVLNNSKYIEHARYASQLFRDRPVSPMNTAIFWIEYVIRHKRTKFLIPHSVDLNFFQIQSIDVIGFLATILLSFLFVIYKVIRCLCSKYLGTRKNKIKLT